MFDISSSPAAGGSAQLHRQPAAGAGAGHAHRALHRQRKRCLADSSSSACRFVSNLSRPLLVRHVLGGGQPDDEEVQDDEEPGEFV